MKSKQLLGALVRRQCYVPCSTTTRRSVKLQVTISFVKNVTCRLLISILFCIVPNENKSD